MFDNAKSIARKFYCLEGFVAIIFSLFSLRAIYITFLCPSLWNLLMAALVTIFAYWWVKRVLAKPRRYKGTYRKSDYHGCRDIDL